MQVEREFLKDLYILIDGYNIGSTKSTGIKTYGLTLIEALKILGAKVGVLFDFDFEPNQPILNAVIIQDIKKTERKEKNVLKLIEAYSLLKLTFKQKIYKVPIDFSKTVLKEDFNYLKKIDIWGGTFKYERAIRFCRITNKILKVKPEINIDVWHSTYPLPLKIKKTKHITTIHDLIPLKLPWTCLDDKKYFFKIVKNSLEISDFILVPSENTKKDILEFYDVNPTKIYVTYQPVLTKPVNSYKKLEKYLKKRFFLEPKNYILFVGTIEPKKNIKRLIEAYSLLNTDKMLVIVGKKGWLWEEDLQLLEFNFSLKKKIRILNYVSYKDLNYLYSGAYCFVFPSLYEGFGLPPLEAMTCKCPVIVSNVASLPEICGEAALYCNPYDSENIAEKIEMFLNDDKIVEEFSYKGLQQAKKFKMEKYIKRIKAVYSKILSL